MQDSIGFIGLGTMGTPMAKNLLKAGFSLRVFDTRPAAVDELVGFGAICATSVADCAQGTTTVITMLPNSPDVRAVVLGSNGLAEVLPAGAIVVDTSTISPTITRDIGEALRQRGIVLLDAPVSGGQKGAIAGSLSIMVGGDLDAFEKVRPILEAMGRTITRMGEGGMGQVTKLCNQLICAINIQGVCEALALGRAAGIDLEALRGALMGGAANSWMLENLGPQMIADDSSAGFRIDLQLKDLKLVTDAAYEWGVPLPGTSLATHLYLEARAHGEGSNGNQALYKVYDRLTAQRNG